MSFLGFGGGGGNRVHVQITGDNQDLNKDLKGARKDIGDFSTGVKSQLGGTASFIKTGFVATAGAALTKFGLDAVNRAEQMNSAYAVTEQVIRQTGGAANLTAQEIKALSKELSLQTGIDKALVTEGNNVLLTFKNLRDEVGDGNDVFSRASRLMLDVSTTMGTDAKSAALQLGKALNDPVANMGALSRAGLTFTNQQKEQIRTLVENGDLLSAQKIILSELESQLGGTAEAAADATDKIANIGKEVQESVGNELLKALEPAAEFLNWLDEVQIGTDAAGEKVSVLGLAIKTSFGGIFGLVDQVREAWDKFFGEVENAGPVALDAADKIHELRAAEAALKAETEAATSAIRQQRREMLAASSPAVALANAQREAEDATEDYHEAVRESGRGSREARDAALKLMEAQAELDAASSVFAEQGGKASLRALEENLRASGVWNDTIAALIDQIGTLNNTPIRANLPHLPSGGVRTGSGLVRHGGGRVNAPRGQEVNVKALGGERIENDDHPEPRPAPVMANGNGGSREIIAIYGDVYGWDDFVEKVREAGLEIARTDGAP